MTIDSNDTLSAACIDLHILTLERHQNTQRKAIWYFWNNNYVSINDIHNSSKSSHYILVV